ncbi:type IV secretory system conjugative DNA transfer family protein [Rhodococcus hoagii]|nr:type IV secretory system conjugative DNA transfer family protein [Prescottella equi]NKR28901.1 type IV secretory system conjugative DNA transfer family protein [Prescottella equi]NKS10222.1 type IV secretory system conjugative DNA transfer family protein [Prescottella equi]NKS35213.1 type IV secretory system conjugative DNA transfer family protein [Prescottella equi]NKS62118.1 type IV secretory system conjugative DNA transfer family protein [Prescottella equi]
MPLAASGGLLLLLGAVKLKSMYESGTPLWILVGLTVLVVAALVVIGVLAWKFIPRNSAHAKMRNTNDVSDMIGSGAAERGMGLRASINSTKDIEMKQLAVAIGRVGKKVLHKSYEDFTIIFMGPRSNKTSAVAVPRILSAPGAVVNTSNKPDLWILTGGLREQVGPVYAFDPGNIAYAPQTWWWNMIGHVKALKEANAIADQFIEDSGGSGADRADPFFTPTARNLLGWTMLAAALEDGRTMRDVLEWITTFSSEPKDILAAHGKRREALAYAALLELPNDTKGGVYGGANTALACIQDEDTLKWITPPDTWEEPHEGAAPIEELDLWSLYAYEDGKAPTLYLMSQEGSASAGPVLATMVNRIFELGDLAASAYGGRVDPPITIVLDECANICRIKRLPDLASHLGSKSICVDAIFQSEAQAQAVWGRDKYDALWSASTVRICGAGLQDPAFAQKLSDLIGTHKVREKNYSYGRGGSSTSEHWVREPIMPKEDVAAMKKTNALLIRQEAKPILMDLMPWYKEPDSGNIVAVADVATAQIQQSAMAALGPDNPVARALMARQQAADAVEA